MTEIEPKSYRYISMKMAPVRGILTETLYASFGGPRTDRKALQSVKPQRLWEIILNRRARDCFQGKNPVIDKPIKALGQAGFEDPLQTGAIITGHIDNLFKLHPAAARTNQLGKAILIFRSVIVPQFYFSVGKKFYFGLAESRGGLEIEPDNNNYARTLRKYFGSLLPKEIIAAPKNKRIACCLEFSQLLTVLLRSAGIEASIYREPGHAYVIAELDGRKYRLDPAKLLFIRTRKSGGSDRESISMHYSNEAFIFWSQLKFDAALEKYDRAIEISPDFAEIWAKKGKALAEMGNYEEAIGYFDRALDLKPTEADIWYGKGIALFSTRKFEDAVKCFDMTIELVSSYEKAWALKGIALIQLGRKMEAREMFAESLALKKAKRNGIT